MIIIENSSQVKILKHSSIIGNVVKLSRNLTGKEIIIEDDIVVMDNYYKVLIPEIEEGEYTYYVMNNDDIVETGLLYFGKLEVSNTSYTEKENQIFVYERK